MKRNIFWTIWGLVTLVGVMIAGAKTFAIEVENHQKSIKATFEKAVPKCFPVEKK